MSTSPFCAPEHGASHSAPDVETAVSEPAGQLKRLPGVERRLVALWCGLLGERSSELLEALDPSSRAQLEPAVRALEKLERSRRLSILSSEVLTRRDERANAKIRAAFAHEAPSLAHLVGLALGPSAVPRRASPEPPAAAAPGPGGEALMGYLRRVGLRAIE